MTVSNIQDQDGNVIPSRAGFVMNQAVDSTSRGYDMRKLQFADETFTVRQASQANLVWVDLTAEGADVYYVFDSAAVGTNTLDDTSINAVGVAWTGFPAAGTHTHAGVIKVGTSRQVRIDRQQDITLILKTASGTANLRINQSSQSLPGATLGA